MTEALVIFSCAANVNSYSGESGCTATSSLYFIQNPDVKNEIDQEGQSIRQSIGPSIVDTVGPALFVIGGGTGIIKVNKYFSLQLKKDSGILTFRTFSPF